PGVLDLPLLIDGRVDARQRNHPLLLVPPLLAPPARGRAQLLPNWEVGRNADMLLPNYGPDNVVTFELLDFGRLSGRASPPAATELRGRPLRSRRRHKTARLVCPRRQPAGRDPVRPRQCGQCQSSLRDIGRTQPTPSVGFDFRLPRLRT